MTAAPVKAVVFDLGGVVFHWRPAELLRRVLPQRVPDADAAAAAAKRFFGGSDWAAFDRGTVEVPQLVQRLALVMGWLPSEVQAVVDGVPGELQPLPGTEELITRLQAAGLPLFFLSNMPRPYAAHLMEHHAVMRRFGGGLFSSHVHLMKPEAPMFERAVQQLGMAPQQLLFLDDSAPNVSAAQALGWQAVQFVDAAQCGAELQARFGLRF